MQILIEKVLDVINKNVNKVFGFELDLSDIQNSTRKEFGDFQTNFAMTKSKILGQNPRQIAQQLIDNFEGFDIIDKIEVAGAGFINIFVGNKVLNETISKIDKSKYEYPVDNNKTVIIDYSSPNIAKRMHVGHLRSTIIGDSLKRIYKELGFNVLGDNHIGDWGTQFGKLIVAYNNWLDKDLYQKNPIEELERLYVLYSTKAKENPSLDDIAREELRKVQTGDSKNLELWKEFINVSMNEYNKVYDRLDIKFDLVCGESMYNDIMPEVLDILKEKNIARIDDGALVVFFDESKNLTPCIVQKKDKSFLYSTSDLATIKYRYDKFKCDIAIYVVDERQQGHFKQVFEIANMLGSPYDYEKHHTQFGIMRFGDGVIFSSRGGNVIRLVDLLDQAKNEVKKVVSAKNPDLSESEIDSISDTIGVGAIKYFDLSQNRVSPILFDWEKVLSFEGNTGPYLQYTYVRIMSILRKASQNGIEYTSDDVLNEYTDEIQRDLVVSILRYPSTLIRAYETNKPNLIADYVYELAKQFNSYYTNTKILDDDNKILMQSRINLCCKLAYTIKNALSLLGINTVERM